MKLIITDTNWADEMDVFGFEILSDQMYDLAIEIIDFAFLTTDSFDIYVGSNEEITVNKNYKYHFKTVTVSNEEQRTINQIFGRGTQGISIFDRLLEYSFDYINEVDIEKFNSFISRYNALQ